MPRQEQAQIVAEKRDWHDHTQTVLQIGMFALYAIAMHATFYVSAPEYRRFVDRQRARWHERTTRTRLSGRLARDVADALGEG